MVVGGKPIAEDDDEVFYSNTVDVRADQIIECEMSIKLSNQKNCLTPITTNDNQYPKRLLKGRSFEESNGSIRKKFSTGKSTLILVVIVVFFVITHSNRLALKVYMSVFPQLNTKENFTACLQQGR